MSALFLKTADNEKEHAKMWFKELAGIGDTKENLAAAAEGKTMSGQICMKALLKQLRKKDSLSLQQNSGVGEIEKHHEERYRALLKNIETAMGI